MTDLCPFLGHDLHVTDTGPGWVDLTCHECATTTREEVVEPEGELT